MRRVLLVVRGPIDPEMFRRRYEVISSAQGAIAVCYELPAGHDGFHDALSAQREVTEALRQACGPSAEDIAIFAVSERNGDRVEDYAREWGATEVCA